MTSRNKHQSGARLPLRIDPDALADSGRILGGRAQWVDLGRLEYCGVRGVSPDVEVRFRAYREPGGAVLIAGDVTAEIAVTCQRCLGELVLPVGAELLVAVARSQREAVRLQEDYETIELDRGAQLSLAGLIEDELLLAVPLVPKHEDRRQCDAEALARLEALGNAAPRRESPFQVLEALRKNER